MKNSLVLVVLIASLVAVVATIADPAATHPAHLHDAAHTATDTPRPRPRLRHDVHKSASRIAHSPAPSRDHPRRRLFGISDVWSWLSDKKQEAMLLQAKDKLRARQNKTHTNATSHANADSDRRLGIKIENTNAAKPPEMGTMFHVIRFFANRVGEINDKAYTAQEEEAARRAAMGSMSSSSSGSVGGDAERQATLKAARTKAAEAYGLTTAPVPTTPPPTTASVQTPTPSPTKLSLLARMEW